MNQVIKRCWIALLAIVVYGGLGIGAIMIVVAAIGILGVSITNMIGITDQPFQFASIHIQGISQILFAIVIAVLLCALAWVCYKGIQRFQLYRKSIQ